MQIHRGSLAQLPRLEGRRAVTLGTFDGVHRGHQAIVAECLREAEAHGLDEAVAVSFAHHPRSVLPGRRSPRILTTLEERIELLAACGLPRLLLLDFDDELSQVGYDRFVSVLRERVGLAHFVLGHDVHFGRDRGGNFESVAELAEAEGFGISQVASVRHHGEPISSTRIRDCIGSGDLAEAIAMLGHLFALSGRVVEGQRLGRQLGFPTANLALSDPLKLRPPLGVYAGWARWAGVSDWQPAVVNIGRAPTVRSEPDIRTEVHVLEGAPELYGVLVTVGLVAYLRVEKEFTGVDALRDQIARDVGEARSLLRGEPKPPPRLLPPPPGGDGA